MGCIFSRPKPTTELDVPVTDIVSYAFQRQRDYDEESKKLFINADDPSQFLSAYQTKLLVRRLIFGLQAAGLKRGDAVLLHLANHYLYGTLFLAIIGAGGVCVGSNPAYQFFELNHTVDLASPRFIITTETIFPLVQQVCQKRGIALDNVFLLETCPNKHPLSSHPASTTVTCSAGGVKPFTSLLAHGNQEADWLRLGSKSEMQSTMAVYYSTSGTTGLPKLAMVSHYAVLAQQVSLHHNQSYQSYEVTRLAALPLFHIFGSAWAFFAPLQFGQPVYVMARFTTIDNFAENIERYSISETYVSPPLVHALNGCPEAAAEKQLRTLRYIGVGGAPIDAVALRKLRGRLHPDATVSQVWGMTEFGPAALFRPGENDDTGSIGRPLQGYEMKLVDGTTRREVKGDGKTGELLVRAPGMMTGYKNLEVSPFEEGFGNKDGEKKWLRTGDIVHIKAGKLYVTGRAKELIKVRGWHVAPAEIEAVLLQHPDVADCAVVGTSIDGGVTEVPRAYVVRKHRQGQSLLSEKRLASAEDIYDYVRQQLASYKRLDGGVVFVDSIPRTASGKTQRFKLAEMDKKDEVVEILLEEG
ncbi:hypothetical protein B0H66DRAFT_17707 [Apodospora peruviana]|uniref:Uncharacterized protein n=1 Tax=Apodospora peruviana TaxID=516989 RepID=A0AAE0IQN2_9PEZI|nr:hypothetical protein B0H66DRAFT_17707 [Apodospora peruviana]